MCFKIKWRSGRAVECTGLENQHRFIGPFFMSKTKVQKRLNKTQVFFVVFAARQRKQKKFELRSKEERQYSFLVG